jgi:predicted dehydrogenase
MTEYKKSIVRKIDHCKDEYRKMLTDERKSRMKIKFGVLGCANIANRAVIPAIKEASNAEAYAIAGRNAEKLQQFKEEHGFKKTYQSYDELLDDKDVDAIYIPLPNGLHYEWALKALKKGKHVLCENH